jgi:hypothetical protein
VSAGSLVLATWATATPAAASITAIEDCMLRALVGVLDLIAIDRKKQTKVSGDASEKK